MLPNLFIPASPTLRRDPFDHDDYIFELKMGGFRTLAHVDRDGTRLISRRGNVYRSFLGLGEAIRASVPCDAVLDGEIVILDSDGRPQFYELLRRRGRGDPVFYVFDVL